MDKTQEAFLNDIATQINQYIYRSIESPSVDLISFLQTAAKKGNLNWHMVSDKNKLALVFDSMSLSIKNYTLANGDFKMYLLLQLVRIISEVYKQELFELYLSKGYNVIPESVVGSISDAYSVQPPQNTNFPGVANTSNEFVPEPLDSRLIPSSLYSTNSD